jgi:hypothetical protein
MPKDVDEYVAENSKRIRDVDSRFVQVDSNRARDLSFGSNFFNVDVAVELYKRSTGDQVVFGHPADSKNFGRGTFGDDRGAWSLVTDVEATADFTKQGRKAAAEALNGKAGAVAEGGIGGDTTAVTTGDTSLGLETGRGEAFASRSANKTRTTAMYAATSVVGSPGELGIFDQDDRLLARVTVDVADGAVDDTDEVRGDVILTFTGSGNGAAVVTNDGEVALADAMRSPKSTVGPSEFAFGDGGTDFSKSDSSLTSEVTRKNAGREPGRDRISAFTRLTEADMNSISVGLSEVGLFDNTGRMIWATTFRAIPSDSPGFNTETAIVVS